MTRKLKVFLLFLWLLASNHAWAEGETVSWKIFEKGVDEAWTSYVAGDYEKARPVFEHLAKMGHPVGQFLMANLYYHGQGIPMDKKLARFWFMEAANQGYQRAFIPLAEMLAKGEGGLLDMEGAYAWYNIAIALLPESKVRKQMINRRDNLGQNLTPAQIGDAQKKSNNFKPQKVNPPDQG
jgi:TPR repeat protein